MSQIASFLVANTVAIFFVYGLAFFALGLAVAVESGRASQSPLARVMGLLAPFGLLHGAGEWAEMFGLITEHDGGSALWHEAAGVTLAATSFAILMVFAVQLADVAGHRHAWLPYLPATLAGLFLVGATILFFWGPTGEELVKAIEILARYGLGLPASLLSCWALLRQRRTFRSQGLYRFSNDLMGVAIAFACYAVLDQIIAGKTPYFPGSVINAQVFLGLVGIPVQVFRAMTAIAMSYFIIGLLRGFQQETERKLQEANQVRLVAQQQALEEQRKRQEETAQLNQELQTAARELTVLYDLSHILASTLELDTLLKEAVQRIVSTWDYVRAASIWLHEDASGELDLMACQGCSESSDGLKLVTEEQPFDRARQLVRAAMNTRCAMGWYPNGAIAPILGEGPSAPGADGQKHAIRPRIVAVPLLWKNETRGGLLLEVGPEQAGFSSADLPLIGAMSVPLSIAVENAILYGEVKSREALRGELLHRIVSAQESERQRIARELHDETGQALTALALGLKGTAETLKRDPRLAAQQLDELRAETGDALDALRRLVLDLRPSQLDDLGLVAALRWYVEDYGERMPVQIEMEVGGIPHRLRPEVESVLFRIAQEALTNVAKHAAANHVQVKLDFQASSVSLLVTDDGIGFNPEGVLKPQTRRKAWGLLGIQERADLVGGQWQIESAPKQGTRISVQVPAVEEKVS